MTISIKVSCNGRYRCPVSYTQNNTTHNLVLDGSTTEPNPDEQTIPFYHGPDAMTLTVGPEEYVPNE